MLNKALLEPEVLKFVGENLNKDLPGLILKGSPFENVSIQELAIQIKGLQIAQKKFPEFFTNPNILYPPKLNLEQTSSEIAAKYKASLVEGESGIDLTGGLGIDTYFISKKFKQFQYCELNTDLAEIATHNFEVLNAENISIHAGDGLEILKKKKQFDWIYVDPARRSDQGGKVFKFEDCEPDIPKNLDLFFENTQNLMIKSSPILDITAGLNELKFVKEIHILAIKNEVKELLWILEKGFKKEPSIKTINFEKETIQELSSDSIDDAENIKYGLPAQYLYEPNAAIMKSGLFDHVAYKTETKKLHQNSHLYTSEKLKEFPGRTFQIIDIKSYKPVDLKKSFKSKKANITTRNFPETVENLRKKFKIKEGGNDYIFFTTNIKEERIVISCQKA